MISVAVFLLPKFTDVNETRVWMRNRDGSGALGGFRPLSRPSMPRYSSRRLIPLGRRFFIAAMRSA